ncbi:MAG: TolC family protein [bacterium]|nr:TolC family protein [bacterium]
MFNRIVAISTVVAALIFAVQTSAQRTITIDDAISLSLKHNKSVQVARLAIQKADARVAEALGSALPTLGVTAGYTRNLQLPVFFLPNFDNPSSGPTPVTIGLNNQYIVQAQAQQLLFNSAVLTGIGASKIYLQAAQAQLAAAEAQAVTDTKKRFYGALLTRELDTIARATLANAEETYRTIGALFKEGLVAEFDQIRTEVALDNIRPLVTDAELAYTNALGALVLQLGLEPTESIVPVGEFSDAAITILAEDEATRRALQYNYELKALDYQVRVTKEFIDINRSDYFPTLALFGMWQNQGQSETFSNWVSASSSAVGLNFSINIFNGFRTQAKVEQSSVDYLTIQQQYAQLSDFTRFQVRTGLNTLKSARLRIEALRATVRQAERGLEISRIRYNEGTGNLLEISDAETALARARVNRVQALHDYVVAVADYERVVGLVNPQYITPVKD